MRINFISNTLLNTQQKDSSTSFKKLDKFALIKQIPNLPCGCCGKKLLSADKYASVITPLSMPLEHMMQKGCLNFVRKLFPESWKVLKQFTYKYPEKSLDEIMESRSDYNALKISVANLIDDSSTMPNTKERLLQDRKISTTFFNIIEKGRSHMKDSKTVISIMAQLKPHLSGLNQEIYEVFENYSKIYPDKTLTEIVKTVYDFHKAKSIPFQEENLKLINEKFENIKKIAPEEDVRLITALENVKQEIMSLYTEYGNIEDKMQDIKRLYNKALKQNKGAYLFHKIMDEIRELPLYIENVDTFIVRAHEENYTDSKILNSIFRPLIASEVQIDENGPNKLGNKIVFCSQCSKSYKKDPTWYFIQQHQDIIKNLQKQIDFIINEIMEKRLKDNFRFYPLISANKIEKITQGKISLNLTNYCEYIIQESKQIIKELEKSIQKLTEERDEKIALLEKYPKLKAELLSEINYINSKKEKLKEKIQTELNLKAQALEYLKRRENKSQLHSHQ